MDSKVRARASDTGSFFSFSQNLRLLLCKNKKEETTMSALLIILGVGLIFIGVARLIG